MQASVDGSLARVTIASFTPNLKEYQTKGEEGGWTPVESTLTLPLSKPRQEWRLRSVNIMSVPGPEYRLVVEKQ